MTEQIPESPDDPVMEAVFRKIQIKDANYVLQQEGRIPCGSMVSIQSCISDGCLTSLCTKLNSLDMGR